MKICKPVPVGRPVISGCEAGVDPAVLSNSLSADISLSNALFNVISPFKMVL